MDAYRAASRYCAGEPFLDPQQPHRYLPVGPGSAIFDATMDEERALGPDGRVFRFDNLRFRIIRRQSPDHRLVECDRSRTPSGYLPVFRLRPLTSGLPCFEARWDDGSIGPRKRERFDLDIDMIDPDTGERMKSFFFGHHSRKTTDATSHHRSDILIKLPSGIVVLDATCTFTVQRAIGVSLAGESSLRADAEATHGTPTA